MSLSGKIKFSENKLNTKVLYYHEREGVDILTEDVEGNVIANADDFKSYEDIANIIIVNNDPITYFGEVCISSPMSVDIENNWNPMDGGSPEDGERVIFLHTVVGVGNAFTVKHLTIFPKSHVYPWTE